MEGGAHDEGGGMRRSERTSVIQVSLCFTHQGEEDMHHAGGRKLRLEAKVCFQVT